MLALPTLLLLAKLGSPLYIPKLKQYLFQKSQVDKSRSLSELHKKWNYVPNPNPNYTTLIDLNHNGFYDTAIFKYDTNNDKKPDITELHEYTQLEDGSIYTEKEPYGVIKNDKFGKAKRFWFKGKIFPYKREFLMRYIATFDTAKTTDGKPINTKPLTIYKYQKFEIEP